MAILVLCMLSVLIGRYIITRSKPMYFAHIALFIGYFVLALFTTSLSPVTYMMHSVFGEELYGRIYDLLQTPSGWIYSIGALACTVELILAVVVAVVAAYVATKQLRKLIKRRIFTDIAEKEDEEESSKKNFISERKIFLRYCRLLN